MLFHRAVSLAVLLLALPNALPAAGIPVVGRVLGPGGEPRAETEVRLESIPPTYELARLRMAGRPGPEPVDHARTGADGTFELAAPEAGMWKVVISAAGTVPVEYRLIPLIESIALPAVRLAPAAELEVRIVDAVGKPRPGIVGAVTLGVRDDAWRPQVRLAVASEGGVARLPLGRGEKIQLEVLADEHPLMVYEVVDQSLMTIDVPAGVAATVCVTDRRKRPLAEAVAYQGSGLLPLGLSDGEGRLALVLQKEDPLALKVVTADRSSGSFDLDFGAGGDETIDLRLDQPLTVHGRVLDLGDRDSVPGAVVWAVPGEFAMADERGRYALGLGIYPTRQVQAVATGYLRGHGTVEEFGTGAASTIGLTPAANLSGKVVDEDGRPLGGIAINLQLLSQAKSLYSFTHRGSADGWRGQTSPNGAFRVAGLPTGIGYQMNFKAESFAPRTLTIEPLDAFESRSGLKVVMSSGRVAEGRVVDEGDLPVAGAEIRLQAQPPPDDLGPARQALMQALASATPYLTGAEGRFEIANLAAGRYDLEVRATGFAPARVPGVPIAEGGGVVDLGTVVLVPGASIEGRVAGPDGTAIADAGVSVEEHRGFMGASTYDQRNRTRTDLRGHFVIADLPPGQLVTLVLAKEGYLSEAVNGLRPPTDEPLVIVLEPAGRLKGTVVDRYGNPIANVAVQAHPDDRAAPAATKPPRRSSECSAHTAPDGSFVIDGVVPGALWVTAAAEGYRQNLLEGIELAAGDEVEVELVLEVGAVVEGTVTTTGGEPVVQASVIVSERRDELSDGSRRISAVGESDAEGLYRVTGAATGAATITVYHENTLRVTKSIEVRPGTTIVDLVLERGFEISGQVVTLDGAPVRGATVAIQEDRQHGLSQRNVGSPRASTGAGAFTFSGVRAGSYVVTASLEGHIPARSAVFEVSGDVTGLLLELDRGATLKGSVLGLDFDELGSLSLLAFNNQAIRRLGRVDFSGQYSFDSLAPGGWRVQAYAAGSGRSTRMQVEIPEGVAEVEKDIEFGPGLTLTGIVLDGGQPLAGANVSVSSLYGTGHGTTGEDGGFRLEDLKAGSHQVSVHASLGIQHMEVLELVGDHELRIEIRTGVVSGFVLDAGDGEPLAGVGIRLERLDIEKGSNRRNFDIWTGTDSRGYFQAPRVREGTWRVAGNRLGYVPAATTVIVVGGGTMEVELRMAATEGSASK